MSFTLLLKLVIIYEFSSASLYQQPCSYTPFMAKQDTRQSG